jgi:hypothetical protein
MKSTLILGVALAACASMPAVALAQNSAAKAVRHHHYVQSYVHHRVEADAISPGAMAYVPSPPASPVFQGDMNAGVGLSGPEWNYRGGDAGYSWEPRGWAQ